MSGPRIAVVVKGYPRLSETFIAQELLALEARGLPLSIWSLRQPTDGARHPMHEAIRAPVTYLPEYLHDAPLRVLAGLGAALRRPRLAGLLRLFARDFLRDPSASRLRRLGQALVLARELPEGVTHIHVHFLHTPASVARYAARLTGRAWTFSAHAKDIWTTPDWELREKLADAAWGVTCTRDGLGRLEGLSTHAPLSERGATDSDEAQVPSPVRERDRVRVENSTDRAEPEPPRRRAPSETFSSLTPALPRAGEGACRGSHAGPESWFPAPTSGEGRSRLLLAYHGLDLARFPAPPPVRPARDGGDPADPLRLVCVGRLVAKKGHDDLLEALARLPRLHWRLTLIGGGELRAELEARAAALGLGERVRFQGALAQPAVIAAMREADLFVLPTKSAPGGDRDGLPNVLMEAASQELPILATAFAGTPEFIASGEHGLLVPPGDTAALAQALQDLAGDPDLRRRLALGARARLVRDFAMEAGIDAIAARLAASAGIALAPATIQTEGVRACAC
ncbi:glycosyltransferase family 4 protein [Methylobacterium dankookense]|uniref:D-inositol-3-phosphate glycosyltransferase n=1 Tax=Methylobacterium dankookense TaxID=560405 RepID=A0A564G476_9HYPH|nr:glycosyltransferase family 4 protein [Methylobacterium dankookense]GJD55179.1 D-inositol-3-phosphate glycosyltransferase [Methylobacterium dankookense]VUF14381.1 GDP-mannose-dependent alpha-(1-6)-phosphatidylinositol monomannoside mannosyltransferase [Methylobacterium dankookense]